MAQQYTAPPFGGQYPSGSPYYPPFQQHGMQQPSQTPPVFSQQAAHPPGGYQISQGVNMARFDANGQARPLGQTFPFPAAPFASDMFKQFANSSIPPPPPPNFPPVPIPNLGIPHFAPSVNTTTSSAFPQNTATAYDPRFPQNLTPQPRAENPFTNRVPSGAPEVGLSEGDANGNSTSFSKSQGEPPPQQALSLATQKFHYPVHLNVPAASPSIPSYPNPFFSNTSNAHSQQPIAAGIGSILQQQSRNDITSLDGTGSGSSYKPISQSPPQISENAKDIKISGQFQANQAKTTERTYENKSVTELRQLAKGALLSFVPHNIQYGDLLREGVDAHLLQQLYDELGIKVDVGKGTKDIVSSATHIQQASVEPARQPTVSVDIPMVLDGSSSGALLGTAGTAQPAPALSPGLERKDRIAQLLAAKAGRPSALRNAPESAPVDTMPQPSMQIASTPLIDKPQDETPSQHQGDPKPRIQTELVKQRMEQLRKESAGRVHSDGVNTVANGMTGPGQVLDVHAPTISLSELSSPAREELMRGGFASMIPGLFMTSAGDPIQQRPAHGPVDVEVHVDSENKSPSRLLGLEQGRALDANDINSGGHLEHSRALDNNNDSFMAGHDVAADDHSDGEIIEAASENNADHRIPAADVQEKENGEVSEDEDQQGNGYRSKQAEIEAMRKRIAEMEQKKYLKRTHSQVDSPESSDNQAPPTKSLFDNATIPHKANAAATAPAGEIANTQRTLGSRSVSRLTPAQMEERAASLKAEFLRQRAQRAQRQKALRDGLPDLNAEVQKTQSRLREQMDRLQEIRQQIDTLDAQILEARKTKTDVLDDIARLQHQLQHGLSGQKEYSDELQKLNTEQATPQYPNSGTMDHTDSETSIIPVDRPVISSREVKSSIGARSQPTAAIPQAPIPQEGDVSERALTNNSSDARSLQGELSAANHQDYAAGDVGMLDESGMQEGDSEWIAPRPGISSYQAIQGSEAAASPETDEIGAEIEDDSDGSASMSDSGSDGEGDYEPADIDSTHSMDMEDEGSDEYDPEEIPIDALEASNLVDEEGDDYEPAESLEILDTPLSNTSEGAAAHAQSFVTEPEPNNQFRDQSITGLSPPKSMDIISTTSLTAGSNDKGHDLQLTEGNTLTKVQEARSSNSILRPLSGEENHDSTGFVPYQSPLNAFKSYRYNPQFDSTAKEGFRSLTYSNNIDPSVPLCRTELSGATCTDSTCEEQHFRHLGLSDDKILVQMSSTSDIQDKALRERYLLGLKHVIAELRQKGVKEFENVATALSAYRRQFCAEQEAV